jgi:hypothetical protein
MTECKKKWGFPTKLNDNLLVNPDKLLPVNLSRISDFYQTIIQRGLNYLECYLQ